MYMYSNFRKKINKGFTLVEMMVVVTLMVILGLLVMTNLQSQRKKSRDNIRIAGMQQIRLALEEYKLACGQYPNVLKTNTKNGRCPNGVELGTFLPHIPKVPEYASGHNKTGQTDEYFYTGLSNRSGGPCYEYHIGVQLEYDADNDFSSAKTGKMLSEDHDWNGSGRYSHVCSGAGKNIFADDQGFYDFRSKSY